MCVHALTPPNVSCLPTATEQSHGIPSVPTTVTLGSRLGYQETQENVADKSALYELFSDFVVTRVEAPHIRGTSFRLSPHKSLSLAHVSNVFIHCVRISQDVHAYTSTTINYIQQTRSYRTEAHTHPAWVHGIDVWCSSWYTSPHRVGTHKVSHLQLQCILLYTTEIHVSASWSADVRKQA